MALNRLLLIVLNNSVSIILTSLCKNNLTSTYLELEQIEYNNEGVDWTNIQFPDNKECLQIIEGRMGVIDFLNEECKISGGSDRKFTNKIIKNLSCDYLQKVKRFSDSKFIIKHYAGN